MPLLLLAALLSTQIAIASTPQWALKDTAQLNGKVLRVACTGMGPGVAQARQEAIDSCKMSAAQYLISDVRMKSLTVSTERDTAYQQEVQNQAQVSGLVCEPKHEQIEETEDRVKLWVLCDFDLSRARMSRNLTPESTTLEKSAANARGEDWVKNRADIETVEAARGKSQSAEDVVERTRVLTVAVVPQCRDVVVTGSAPARLLRCDRNPISILIEPGDQKVLIRADGHFPKSILLGSGGELRAYAKVMLQSGT
jgi:hypothetical protein